MKNKRFLTFVIAAVLTAGGLAVYNVRASQGAGSSERGPTLQRIIKGLDLNDEQLGKIKTELRAEKDTLVPMIKNLHAARKALREAIHASDATEASVRDASTKVAAAESDLAVERMKLSGKIAPILTEEQIGKVKRFEEKADEAVIAILKRVGEALEKN